MSQLCLAVWRDPAGRELVACADDALPGHDWCGWHLDRRNGPTLMLDREWSEAVRVERPGDRYAKISGHEDH